MIRVLGTDEEVHVDPTASDRPDGQPHLDIGENQFTAAKTTGSLGLDDALVRLRAVVVRDAERSDWGRGLLQRV